MSTWIVGTASGLLGLLGLFLASRATDDGMYVFGFALLVFGIFMVFWLIKHAFDAAAAHEADAAPSGPTAAVAAE
jgi:hypothetical protein